jgi:iron(III) transport system substrate-binding protein
MRTIRTSTAAVPRRSRTTRALIALIATAVLTTACSGGEDPLVVYSGRNENLVGGLFAEFTARTGIPVEVRYGDTAELAIQLLEEGARSPADLYFSQDAGALGALESAGLLAPLPSDVVELIDPRYRSRDGRWVGITGRSRVLVHASSLAADELPDSVFDLVDPRWSGRVAWAPTNGSFQSFVTAMRLVHGEAATRAWLEGMVANGTVAIVNNTGIVEAVGRGEVAIGLTNNYYLPRFTAEDPNFPAVNRYLPGDIGGMVNVAGIGILASSQRGDAAAELVRFLLSAEMQQAFSSRVDAAEFPLRPGVDSPLLPRLDSLGAPDIDLSRLEDLKGTLELLTAVGALQ